MGFMVYGPLVIHCLFCIAFMAPVIYVIVSMMGTSKGTKLIAVSR